MAEEIEYQNKGKSKKTILHEDQHFYQYIEVDGFLNKANSERDLYIHFPSKLGEIMVSFSQPKMQTLKPDKSGTHYRQKLELIK